MGLKRIWLDWVMMVKDGCPEYCPCPALVLGGSEWSYRSDDGLLDVRFAAIMSSVATKLISDHGH
jgi:hypothetical protein